MRGCFFHFILEIADLFFLHDCTDNKKLGIVKMNEKYFPQYLVTLTMCQ